MQLLVDDAGFQINIQHRNALVMQTCKVRIKHHTQILNRMPEQGLQEITQRQEAIE